jgi:hypothetical protein
MKNNSTTVSCLQYGSSNLPPHLKRLVSDTAFEAAVNEIEVGCYPDMHLVHPVALDDSAPASAFESAVASNLGCVRVYVGSQAAAGVPENPGKSNLDDWRMQKLAQLQHHRISVILCCCNDGSSAQWRPFESSGIRFLQASFQLFLSSVRIAQVCPCCP